MIEFWYEFASTYSYPAAMRLEEVAEHQRVGVKWCPFLLGPIFRDMGWHSSPFNEQPLKGAYMWRDLERTCSATGLDFRRPDPFPQNSLLAARVATALPDTGPRATFSKAVYHLEFAKGLNISTPEGLAEALDATGYEPAALLAAATTPETKAALRQSTEQAVAHGVFGAPTWRCSDGEIFWGNDRLEEAMAWENAIG